MAARRKGALVGPGVCVLWCCHRARSARRRAGGLTSRAELGRVCAAGRRLERDCAAPGGEESGSHGWEAVSEPAEQGLCLCTARRAACAEREGGEGADRSTAERRALRAPRRGAGSAVP